MIRRELHDLELESLSVDYNWSAGALWRKRTRDRTCGTVEAGRLSMVSRRIKITKYKTKRGKKERGRETGQTGRETVD